MTGIPEKKLYMLATSSITVDKVVLQAVKRSAKTVNPGQFNQATVNQAQAHLERQFNLTSKEKQRVINCYAVLTERRYPVPRNYKEELPTVGSLTDTKRLDLALLLTGHYTVFRR